MNRRKLLIKYAVTAAFSAIPVLLILWLLGLSSAETAVEKYRILSDAFAVPGVVLMLFAGLVWVSNDGFFDGLGYAFSRVRGMFIPMAKIKHQTYYDYKMEKRGKEPHHFWHLFLVGLAYTLIAVVFLMLYSSVG